MNIGKVIRLIRLKKDIKAIDFAKKLSISRPYLSLMENNKTTPSMRLLKLISKEFEVPMAVFFLYEDDVSSDLRMFFNKYIF